MRLAWHLYLPEDMGSKVDSVGGEIAPVGVSPSCRLDWVSLSYFGATKSLQREQIHYFIKLLDFVAGTHRMAEGGGRRFFEESWFHPSGLSLKWTEPGNAAVNSGLLSVELKGSLLSSLPASVRKALYLDLHELEGFKQCTRMDVQRTVVNPHSDADEIHKRLVNREVWVPKFSGWRPGALVDADGKQTTGCLIGWGSPKGTCTARTYDKRAELKEVGPPAVRHELQLRKQPARDRWLALVDELLQEDGEAETRAEMRFVQSNLGQSMTYLDTSRLKDVPRDQWPRNWARDSQPADFWKEVVEGDVKEYTTKWRFDVALERAMANKWKQYGRLTAKYISKCIWVDGDSLKDLHQDEMDQAFVRMRDEDVEEILEQVPEDEKDAARKWMNTARRKAAKNVEDGEGLKGQR